MALAHLGPPILLPHRGLSEVGLPRPADLVEASERRQSLLLGDLAVQVAAVRVHLVHLQQQLPLVLGALGLAALLRRWEDSERQLRQLLHLVALAHRQPHLLGRLVVLEDLGLHLEQLLHLEPLVPLRQGHLEPGDLAQRRLHPVVLVPPLLHLMPLGQRHLQLLPGDKI